MTVNTVGHAMLGWSVFIRLYGNVSTCVACTVGSYKLRTGNGDCTCKEGFSGQRGREELIVYDFSPYKSFSSWKNYANQIGAFTEHLVYATSTGVFGFRTPQLRLRLP